MGKTGDKLTGCFLTCFSFTFNSTQISKNNCRNPSLMEESPLFVKSVNLAPTSFQNTIFCTSCRVTLGKVKKQPMHKPFNKSLQNFHTPLPQVNHNLDIHLQLLSLAPILSTQHFFHTPSAAKMGTIKGKGLRKLTGVDCTCHAQACPLPREAATFYLCPWAGCAPTTRACTTLTAPGKK